MKPTPPNLGMIAAELRARPQWVVWRLEERADGKSTKVPYCAAEPSRKASTTNPATWATFELAAGAAELRLVDGLGFVFADDDPYFGIDVDELSDEERDWIVETLDTYTERSVSGTGLHVIGRGKLDGHGRHPKQLGVFDRERYFVFTGRIIDGRSTIEDRQAELEAVLERFMPPKPALGRPQVPRPVAVDDQELIARAMSARNGLLFSRLWNGRIDEYPSHSEADLALCRLLVFWTGGDGPRVDRLFRASGLWREKWDRLRGESTYGAETIAVALGSANAFYSPGSGK